MDDGMPEAAPVPPDGVAFMARPELLAMINPFGKEDCAAIDLTCEVDPSQLADEIYAMVGIRVQISICRVPVNGAVTEASPRRMHVCPVVQEDVLREVIAAHEIDPDYGLTEEQRERRNLIAKLRDGREMTGQERDRLLLLTLTESK